MNLELGLDRLAGLVQVVQVVLDVNPELGLDRLAGSFVD